LGKFEKEGEGETETGAEDPGLAPEVSSIDGEDEDGKDADDNCEGDTDSEGCSADDERSWGDGDDDNFRTEAEREVEMEAEETDGGVVCSDEEVLF
jgi:hypothetical protein